MIRLLFWCLKIFYYHLCKFRSKNVKEIIYEFQYSKNIPCQIFIDQSYSIVYIYWLCSFISAISRNSHAKKYKKNYWLYFLIYLKIIQLKLVVFHAISKFLLKKLNVIDVKK